MLPCHDTMMIVFVCLFVCLISKLLFYLEGKNIQNTFFFVVMFFLLQDSVWYGVSETVAAGGEDEPCGRHRGCSHFTLW